MPVKDPITTSARDAYVQEVLKKQLLERQAAAREFEASQQAVRDFLASSNLDRIIRQTLNHLGRPFKSTKLDKDQIPLDGNFVLQYPPAFLIDRQGVVGFTKQCEYPGLRYSLYIDLDEVVIALNLCKDELDCVCPYIVFTHRNGRTHLIDRESSITGPSPEELRSWLGLELYDFLPSPRLFEIVMAKDWHTPSTG